MKNRTVVAPKATVGMKDAVRTWLSSDNKLFTALMERRVTNRQMLLLCHAMVPFSQKKSLNVFAISKKTAIFAVLYI